jgi:Holliday junction DNA helicase RuvA
VIATLQGRIADRGENFVVVETGGIGFKVHVPATLLAQWGKSGREVQLFTHLHLRENEMSLYGFDSEEALNFFELLLAVSGIGPKLALTVLSRDDPESLRAAIGRGDVEYLTRTPGIGKKVAQRIILDLKGKLEAEELAPVAPLTPMDQDVVAALASLGYSLSEAREALASLPQEEMTVEERLLHALSYFGHE